MKHTLDAGQFDRDYKYEGTDLGAVYTEKETAFKVWAPGAEAVTVNLYRTGSDAEPDAGLIARLPMDRDDCGVWKAAAADLKPGCYYTYTVCTDGAERETADVYTKACGVNGLRSMVVYLRGTDPEGFRENEDWLLKRRELAKCPVIYELHIKDFSSDPDSGVSAEYRGKYLAFTQRQTSYKQEGKMPTGISYLEELGITHVHLLPFFDYGSVDEAGDLEAQFNWGYDPVHYNVPEGSYSTDPFHGEVRIRECKQMIQALHAAGIAVVMDVVYNHTYSTDSVFERTVPGYYYRREADGGFANGSLCGNDTASERAMYRKYMIDSVCYWAEEYQIDGFRFDLMGLHDVETMNEIRAALDRLPHGEDILMYGEPWSGDYSPMQPGCIPALKENLHLLDDRIAVFCDNTRDAVKGDVFIADEPGYVNGYENDAAADEAVRNSVRAWCGGITREVTPKHPGQIISYVSAHDNFTLWDKLTYTLPEHAGRKKKQIDFSKEHPGVLKQNKMAAGIYFTCLGTAFFQAGEEFGRTKLGLSDSYNAPPALNALSWKRCAEFSELTEYYRGLIAFRRRFANIYGRDAWNVEVEFYETNMPGLIAYRMQTPGDELFILYNRNKEKTVLPLPEGVWQTVCDGDAVVSDGGTKRQISGSVLVKNEAVMIFQKVISEAETV